MYKPHTTKLFCVMVMDGWVGAGDKLNLFKVAYTSKFNQSMDLNYVDPILLYPANLAENAHRSQR